MTVPMSSSPDRDFLDQFTLDKWDALSTWVSEEACAPVSPPRRSVANDILLESLAAMTMNAIPETDARDQLEALSPISSNRAFHRSTTAITSVSDIIRPRSQSLSILTTATSSAGTCAPIPPEMLFYNPAHDVEAPDYLRKEYQQNGIVFPQDHAQPSTPESTKPRQDLRRSKTSLTRTLRQHLPSTSTIKPVSSPKIQRLRQAKSEKTLRRSEPDETYETEDSSRPPSLVFSSRRNSAVPSCPSTPAFTTPANSHRRSISPYIAQPPSPFMREKALPSIPPPSNVSLLGSLLKKSKHLFGHHHSPVRRTVIITGRNFLDIDELALRLWLEKETCGKTHDITLVTNKNDVYPEWHVVLSQVCKSSELFHMSKKGRLDVPGIGLLSIEWIPLSDADATAKRSSPISVPRRLLQKSFRARPV